MPTSRLCFPYQATDISVNGFLWTGLEQHPYQNSEGWSYEVTLKAGSRGYGRSGVTGSAGVYNVGARTRPQLIGCALAQEPGVLNFGLGLQTTEGDEYAETGR